MRCPFATWHGPLPTTNYAPGAMGPIIGMTVHHIDGSLASADGTFHTPGVERSAHFGIDFDGTLVQWVDTTDVAYHACRANWTGWVGVENASDAAQHNAPPTAAQIATMGRLAAWLGIAPVPATSPVSGGIGYHRQFPGDCSSAWGETECPGAGFIAAIPAICAAARPAPPAPSPNPQELPVDTTYVVVTSGPNAGLFAFIELAGKVWMHKFDSVNAVGNVAAQTMSATGFDGFLSGLQRKGLIDNF